MTDIAIGETPPELVPPVPPEAPAELDAATPEAGAPAVGEVESFDRRISIPESLGPVRRAILEGLIDTEGPMSVSQLHAVMPPGTPRSTAEASILREFRSGRIERVSAGHYVLAKPKPPEPSRHLLHHRRHRTRRRRGSSRLRRGSSTVHLGTSRSWVRGRTSPITGSRPTSGCASPTGFASVRSAAGRPRSPRPSEPLPIVSSATSCSPPPTAISRPVLLSMTSGRSGRYLKFFRSIACSW